MESGNGGVGRDGGSNHIHHGPIETKGPKPSTALPGLKHTANPDNKELPSRLGSWPMEALSAKLVALRHALRPGGHLGRETKLLAMILWLYALSNARSPWKPKCTHGSRSRTLTQMLLGVSSNSLGTLSEHLRRPSLDDVCDTVHRGNTRNHRIRVMLTKGRMAQLRRMVVFSRNRRKNVRMSTRVLVDWMKARGWVRFDDKNPKSHHAVHLAVFRALRRHGFVLSSGSTDLRERRYEEVATARSEYIVAYHRFASLGYQMYSTDETHIGTGGGLALGMFREWVDEKSGEVTEAHVDLEGDNAVLLIPAIEPRLQLYHQLFAPALYERWLKARIDRFMRPTCIIMDSIDYHRTPPRMFMEALQKRSVEGIKLFVKECLTSGDGASIQMPEHAKDTVEWWAWLARSRMAELNVCTELELYAREKGHVIIYTPKGHGDLQPMEMLWARLRPHLQQLYRMCAGRPVQYLVSAVRELSTKGAMSNLVRRSEQWMSVYMGGILPGAPQNRQDDPAFELRRLDEAEELLIDEPLTDEEVE